MRLWVLGDSWTDPRTYLWSPSSNWIAVLAARLGVGVVNSAASGAGYLRNPGTTIPMQAAQGFGVGADAVIVFGSVNDPGQGFPAPDVGAAAAVTFGLIRRACPGAPLLVVGPQWNADPPPQALVDCRAAVAAAAATVGADFVDPSGWFTGRQELMLDAWHPIPAGHVLVADRLEHDVALALTARPTLPA